MLAGFLAWALHVQKAGQTRCGLSPSGQRAGDGVEASLAQGLLAPLGFSGTPVSSALAASIFATSLSPTAG